METNPLVCPEAASGTTISAMGNSMRIQNAFQITMGEKPPQNCVAVLSIVLSSHRRHMIDADKDVQSGFVIEFYCASHVGGTIIMEGFLKIPGSSPDIAKMDKPNARGEVRYENFEICAHRDEVRLTEGDAMRRAVGK